LEIGAFESVFKLKLFYINSLPILFGGRRCIWHTQEDLYGSQEAKAIQGQDESMKSAVARLNDTVAQASALVDVRRGGPGTVHPANEDCRKQQEPQQQQQLTFPHPCTVELHVVRPERAIVKLSSPISLWLWIDATSF